MVSLFNSLKESRLFQSFVIGIILLSSLLIGVSTFEIEDRYLAILVWFDYAITSFFVFELIIRFLGDKEKYLFFKDPWNAFDSIIVVGSLIPSGGSSILLLRLFRIFRVLRLVSALPELKRLIESLMLSMAKVSYVCILLFIVLYIYASFGSILFEEVDPDRWNDIGLALMTLVQVLTLSSWEQVFLPLQAEFWWAWIFFFSFIAIGAITILNLIIAVLVDVVSKHNIDS